MIYLVIMFWMDRWSFRVVVYVFYILGMFMMFIFIKLCCSMIIVGISF